MTIHLNWRRAAANLAALGLTALLLSACVIASKAPLIGPDEATAAFGDSFPFTTYDGNGPWTKAKDAGVGGFKKATDGNVYGEPTGAMKVSFVPRTDGSQLVAIESKSDNGEVGYMYGLAHVRDGIMALQVILATDPAADLAAAGVAAPAGAVIESGGVNVSDRATLDAVIDLLAAGTIKASPIIAYIGPGDAPATIVADGDWYKAQ